MAHVAISSNRSRDLVIDRSSVCRSALLVSISHSKEIIYRGSSDLFEMLEHRVGATYELQGKTASRGWRGRSEESRRMNLRETSETEECA